MKYKKLFKVITFLFALLWIVALTVYSSMILGTFIHESMHATNAIGLKAIEINYDGSGVTRANHFNNSDNEMHKWIYFNGYIVFMALMTITSFCIVVLVLFSFYI